jgi:hypothetical protein
VRLQFRLGLDGLVRSSQVRGGPFEREVEGIPRAGQNGFSLVATALRIDGNGIGGLPERGVLMPYLICPACRLSTVGAAGFVTADRCPRCDGFLGDAEPPQGVAPRWKVFDRPQAAPWWGRE